MNWLNAFGRLHPLVLHVPIGLLVGLALLEILTLRRRTAVSPGVWTALAWVTAGSAVLSAATGYTLSREGGYADLTLQNHLRLGIAVAVASVAFAVARARNRAPWVARSLLFITLGLLLPAGHLGATLTHGADFLVQPLQTIADSEADSTYGHDIAPIFAARCGACHGERKRKGGLDLGSPASIAHGSKNGPVIIVGQPEASPLLRRVRLDLTHEDHMPPAGKPQPSPSEIATIEAWIAAGAPFAGTLTLAKTAAPTLVPAPAEAIAALRQRLVHAQEVTQASPLLWIDFAAVAPDIADADIAALLEPVRAQVADLSLARTHITDASLALIAQMTNLQRLDLRATAITGAGLAQLVSLSHLEQLNLAQTTVDDAAIELLLGSIPSLQRLYVWHAPITAEHIARWHEKRPTLEVVTGTEPSAAVLESEPDIKLTSDAAVPDQPRTASTVDVLKPVNSVCPVSGGPIDAQHAIVFHGRVIGFCCGKCPAEFWADPARFENKLP